MVGQASFDKRGIEGVDHQHIGKFYALALLINDRSRNGNLAESQQGEE